MIKTIFIASLFFTCTLAGYIDVKHDPSDVIHLHIVPIVSNPSGGLNTMDEHFSSASDTFSTVPVTEPLADASSTLDKVIDSLNDNPNRIFTCPDTMYFQKWWGAQDDKKREQVKKLVQNGQLRFSTGAYVANDEATAHYEDIIENIILGHRFLRSVFNYVPLTGWGVRSHGNSATQALLLSESGLNFNFIEQINFQNRRERASENNLEFIWRPFESLQKKDNYLFTFINPIEPGDFVEVGYCFGSSCEDPDFGNKKNINRLAVWAQETAQTLRSTQLLLQVSQVVKKAKDIKPMYEELDKVIEMINSNPTLKIKASYSSPDHFAAAWLKEYSNEAGMSLRVKTDDFFPYADHPRWFDLRLPGYHSGYYTSRPTFKKLVRDSGKLLQAARKIALRAWLRKDLDYGTMNAELLKFEKIVAEVQNVNGVSGTSNDRVIEDYTNRLNDARTQLLANLALLAFKKEDKDISSGELSYFQCDFTLGLEKCDNLNKALTDNKKVLLKLYNPGTNRTDPISIPLSTPKYKVRTLDGQDVKSDVVCYPSVKYETNNCRLYFQASFPSFGFRHFVLETDSSRESVAATPLNTTKVLSYKANTTIEFDKDMRTIRVKNCDYQVPRYGRTTCFEDEVKMDYLFYRSYKSNQEQSGIHVFMPTANTGRKLKDAESVTYLETAFFHEFRITRPDAVYTRIRIDKASAESPIEIETHLLPINFDNEHDLNGKEVALRIKSTKIKSYRVFKTDSNGLDLITRAINSKPDFKVDNYDLGQVAGNYYPITSILQIEDYNSGQKLSIIPDRTQGGTSLDDGELELMINRRVLQHDFRGVNTSLDETHPEIHLKDVTRVEGNQTITTKENVTVQVSNDLTVVHKLVFSFPKAGYSDSHRKVQVQRDNAVQVFMASVDSLNSYSDKESEFKLALPENIHLALRAFDGDEIMIRFVNYDDSDTNNFELFALSGSKCTNNLLKLLAGGVESDQQYCVFSEVSMSMNQPYLDIVRNKIMMHDDKYSFSSIFDGQNIYLKPMQTRSVIVSPHNIDWPASPAVFNPLKAEGIFVAPLPEIYQHLDEPSPTNEDEPSPVDDDNDYEPDVFQWMNDFQHYIPSDTTLILLTGMLISIPIVLAAYLRMFSTKRI